MSMSDGFEQYRILLKELSKPKVDYKKLKSGIKGWLKSLNKSKVNKKFLERLRCKGFTSRQINELVSKVVITGEGSVLWSRIAKVVNFEPKLLSQRQTLRDIVVRLIDIHKLISTTNPTEKLKRRVLIVRFVALLGLLLVIFNVVDPRNIMSGGFGPLSKYIDSDVPEFKTESTGSDCNLANYNCVMATELLGEQFENGEDISDTYLLYLSWCGYADTYCV